MPRFAPSPISPELLARVVKGDQQALEQLYDQSSSLLFTLALRILGDREEAADVLQEVYLEIWRKLARYDPGRGSPMAWLVTLTRARAVDRLRARPAMGRGLTESLHGSPADGVQGHAPAPAQSQASQALHTLVVKALADLPDGQQQGIEQAYYEGLSHTEIAARLNQPAGAIKTQIKLGMSTLLTTLRPCWEQE